MFESSGRGRVTEFGQIVCVLFVICGETGEPHPVNSSSSHPLYHLSASMHHQFIIRHRRFIHAFKSVALSKGCCLSRAPSPAYGFSNVGLQISKLRGCLN